MILETVGLTITFLLISTVLLWILIKSKVPIIIKLLLVFAVLWYGVVLLNIPGNYMGWSKPMTEADYKGQYIKDYFILEPTKEKKGFIYFWLIDQIEIEGGRVKLPNKFFLDEIFIVKWIGVPRAYSFKYSKDSHKKILEASKKAKNMPGSLIKIKENKKGSEGEEIGHDTKVEFEVINPRSVFIKED